MRTWIGVALLFGVLGCRGDMGAMGLQGPQGPPGEQGPPGPNVDRGQLPCPGPVSEDGGTVSGPAMVDIGASCIDSEEAPNGSDFGGAWHVCRRVGRRLCTYGEWFIACRDFSSQVTAMTDNFELVDEVSADGDGGVVMLVVGNGSCKAGRAVSPSEVFPFRCCL